VWQSEAALRDLEVLVVDCQATAAAPRGALLEIGWARVGTAQKTGPLARLIRLPPHHHIPRAVARITGISEEMTAHGVHADEAWKNLLAHAAMLGMQPPPTVIHFARFEEPFLRLLSDGPPPLDIVCTNDIARRRCASARVRS
jgi:hypothetical protein